MSAAENPNTQQPFPWQLIQRFGLGFLRLNSKDFWAMSPREIFEAISFHSPASVSLLDKTTMSKMIARYPDTGSKN